MQALDTDSTLKQLLYSFRGAKQCHAELLDFKMCRATPNGNIGDPEVCEAKVSNFLQCNHDM